MTGLSGMLGTCSLERTKDTLPNFPSTSAVMGETSTEVLFMCSLSYSTAQHCPLECFLLSF